MKTERTRVILLGLSLVLFASPAAEANRAIAMRNVGITATGVLGAFDCFNRALLLSELAWQSIGCLDDACLETTHTLELCNTIGLGFSVAPPVALLATMGAYLLHHSENEPTVAVVAGVASAIGLASSIVELGTVATGLSIVETTPINSTDVSDDGRWIASTMLSAGSVAAGTLALLAHFSARQHLASRIIAVLRGWTNMVTSPC